MPRKNKKERRRARRQHQHQPFVNQLRSALTPAQRQSVTVPVRQVITINFGQSSQDLTFARVAEQGLVSNVYGHNSGPLFGNMKRNWEFFYVDSMQLQWCPSNLVGTFGDIGVNFSQQSLGPFVFTDDPDTYSQNGDSLDTRLQKPTFTLKPVLQPWTLHRDNRQLYGAGVLSPGDTAQANPMYDQISKNPLAGASLGLQLPGTGSTVIGSRYFAGMMVLTYMVRFVSIKPNGASNTERPSVIQQEGEPASVAMPAPPRPPVPVQVSPGSTLVPMPPVDPQAAQACGSQMTYEQYVAQKSGNPRTGV